MLETDAETIAALNRMAKEHAEMLKLLRAIVANERDGTIDEAAEWLDYYDAIDDSGNLLREKR